MEQTVSERPLSQDQHINQLHTQHNGTVNSSGAHLKQDPIERWCPRTGWRGTTHSGSFGGNHLRQDKVQMPLCRDNFRGKCTRGAFCKYRHSESDEHDRSRFCQGEREKLGAVPTLGNSQLYRENEDTDSTTRFSSRGCRRRSPCRRFQSGRCYRGVSCPYLHPEMTSFDKPIHDSRVDQQQVDRAVRDPGFGGRNRDNFVRISQEHVDANKENNSRIMPFSVECRSRSPCQHFLRGKCDFGASCNHWHPVNTYVSSRHDLNTQHHQGNAATSSYPGSGERSRDVTLRTPQEHEEVNMNNHLRTGAYSREPRSRSPCRNFLSGKCYRGGSCVHFHPVTVYDRTRFDLWSAQQNQGVSGNSRSSHFVDGSIATTFRISQNHDYCKNYANQPYRDRHAFYEQNKAWSTKDGVQLAGNRENMDVTSRSWSYERQRNRLTDDFGSDKPIREVCLQFTKGRCNRGELCRYLHGYHEYATSTSNWSEKPNTEAAGDSRNFGVANQYANTTMSQERAGVRNYQMSLGESKHTESSVILSDGCFDKEAKGRSVDDAMDFKIRMGDATTMDGPKYEVSGEKVESFCNSAEGHENISLWSRPFKRKRSRSRSPFTSQDDFHCPKFRKYDSRVDLRGGRSYNVAQFQYPDRRSYRYEKLMFHANSQRGTNSKAASVNPCSCENKESKFVTPQRRKEVVTQGLQLDQRANGGHGSNFVLASEKNVAGTARCALQPSHTNQNDKELAVDSVAVDSSGGAAAISQDALESGSTCSCGKNLVSPSAIDRTMLEKEANVKVPIDFSQEGTPSLKTYSRKKSRKKHLVSCEETMKEEVIDASKQGTPSCSLVEASLSDPNSVPVSGVPIDMKMSASSDSDLANVLMHDHPVKSQKKKKRKKKCSSSASLEETMVEEVTEASKPGTPISSLAETSLSNPNIVSVSGIPVDMKTSASNNSNDLENVLMHNHPVKHKVKKRPKKRSKSASCEETMVEEVTEASKPGTPISSLAETSLSNSNIVSVSGVPVDMKTSAYNNNDLENVRMCDSHVKQQALQSSLKVAPNSRRKLLVLDVNGILVDIVTAYNPRYKPDTKVAAKAVYKRPFCDDFLQFCFERFDVGIWSSRTNKNLNKVVDFLMRDTKKRLLFCWDQSHCTATEYKTLENREKPLVLKELRYLWWDNKGACLPWDKGYYNEANTVLLDDSPYKALRNPPHTAIFPRPYSYKNAGDNSLGPGGDLRVYLERLADAENVQKFIKENPFGQRPISNTNRSWHFYAKIVGTYGSQQEEYANITPHS